MGGNPAAPRKWAKSQPPTLGFTRPPVLGAYRYFIRRNYGEDVSLFFV